MLVSGVMESVVITKLTIPTQPRTTNKLTLCICESVPDSGSAVHSNSVEYSNCLPEGHLGFHGATRGYRHRTESPHTLVRRPHEEGSMLDTEAGKHTTSLSRGRHRGLRGLLRFRPSPHSAITVRTITIAHLSHLAVSFRLLRNWGYGCVFESIDGDTALC